MSRAAVSLSVGQWKVDTSPPQKALLSRLEEMARSIVDRGWWMVDIEGGQLKMDSGRRKAVGITYTIRWKKDGGGRWLIGQWTAKGGRCMVEGCWWKVEGGEI